MLRSVAVRSARFEHRYKSKSLQILLADWLKISGLQFALFNTI